MRSGKLFCAQSNWNINWIGKYGDHILHSKGAGPSNFLWALSQDAFNSMACSRRGQVLNWPTVHTFHQTKPQTIEQLEPYIRQKWNIPLLNVQQLIWSVHKCLDCCKIRGDAKSGKQLPEMFCDVLNSHMDCQHSSIHCAILNFTCNNPHCKYITLFIFYILYFFWILFIYIWKIVLQKLCTSPPFLFPHVCTE